MCVIGGDETPLVFTDIVDLATHVVVATNYINLVLVEETLVRDTQLVHRVETLPTFGIHIE